MVDFGGKPGPGIMNLNLHFAGDYDACLNVKGSYNGTDDNIYQIESQYCRIGINRENVSLCCMFVVGNPVFEMYLKVVL